MLLATCVRHVVKHFIYFFQDYLLVLAVFACTVTGIFGGDGGSVLRGVRWGEGCTVGGGVGDLGLTTGDGGGVWSGGGGWLSGMTSMLSPSGISASNWNRKAI